jgi:acyl carrier protein
MPDFEEFRTAARLALKETMDLDDNSPEIQAFDKKGKKFNFYVDGGVDSLDMLDIAFSVDKQLRIKTNFDAMVKEDEAITLGNLFASVRQQAPA